MGKPKKGKKGRQDEDFGDDEVEIDILKTSETSDEVVPPKTNKQKKGKKNKKDNSEDDIDSKIQTLALDSGDDIDVDMSDEPVLPQKSKKKDKKKAKKKEESDDEEEAGHAPVRPAAKAGFAMLDMGDEGDSLLSSENEEKAEIKVAEEKAITREESIEEKQTKEQDGDNKQKQQKKGKKDKKKKKNEQEDIDALLAEIEGKTAQSQGIDFKEGSAMTEEDMLRAMEAEYDDVEDKKKKTKKKQKQQKEEQTDQCPESIENGATEELDGGEVLDEGEMTAAQKKKEKKERQKQKKAEEKAKQKDKKGKPAEETPETPTEEKTVDKMELDVDQKQEEMVAEEKAGEEEQAEGGDDEDSKKKKKKDRKKKKGEKEGEEKDTKKKTSKLGKMILEQQKKLREEEERIRLEMEEKERKIEEARREKEEKEKRDKERKEREKQKKKDKIERQKKEGTFMTAKQKEAQRIAQQKLEAMKAQGFEIPSEEPVKKKRPVYDNRKRKKQEVTSQTSQENEEEKPAVIETIDQEKVKDVSDGSKEEEVKDAWDASEDEEDVKDAWDQESEEEEEPEKPPSEAEEKSESVEKEARSDEESDEDESSSEEESSEEDSEEESSSEDEVVTKANSRERALNRIKKRTEEAEKNRSTEKLRAAVVCVLGHVDTGKTKILDKLRKTNVQDNEAGGITQQIGATNVPDTSIQDSTKMCKEFSKKPLKLPGLLIIDTPGHESFSNLRTRGSSLCDIAVLVVDIMHGLEAQTLESINLLKQRRCPFVVALNKIDRLFQWQSNPHSDIMNVLKKQKQNTKQEFDERAQQVKTQLSEQGLNAEMFYDNKNPKEYISLVPTSAHTGDGMGNLIALICELSQNYLAKDLAYSELSQATVMEVKALPGLGTTIDVILVNGSLTEGDTIVVPGTDGPIVTQIRGLLMPQPMKELRVKSAYVHHKEVVAAQGVKIIAKDLDHSLAGLPMHVAKYADEIDIYKEQLEDALEDILSGIKLQDKGVFVQASTLGSMEALLKFLKDSEIPYSGINIGPVHKKDVMKASVMLDRDPQYAVILAFDVKVERDANDMAESLGIRIFTAEIIYHLFDSFMDYRAKYKKGKQEEFKHVAVFPCKLRVLPQYIFNSRDPIVVGVVVEAGFVTLGTPLCVPSKENIHLGQVTSIEINHKQIDKAYKGQEVCIKIENIPGETPKLYGRHFDHTDVVVSKISRESIDAVKSYFRDEMTKADWHVMVELKKLFQIL